MTDTDEKTTPQHESPLIGRLMANEVAIAERAAGIGILSLEDPTTPKMDLLGALCWVHERRTDGKTSFKAYMESHTMEEILKMHGFSGDDEDEDEADDSEEVECLEPETTPSESSKSKPSARRGSA